MRFSSTYIYCPGESTIHSGKGLLHWKALQIDFEKCHFGKRLLSDIYSLATAQPKSSLGLFREIWGGDRYRGHSINDYLIKINNLYINIYFTTYTLNLSNTMQDFDGLSNTFVQLSFINSYYHLNYFVCFV